MNPVAEKVLVAVLGGVCTAALLAAIPNAFSWLVRPAVPQNAVVAFNGECPDHWKKFEAAGGRFIVGAGTHPNPHQTYVVGNTGGAEAVTLTVAQIPSHEHSIKSIRAGNSGYGLSGHHTEAINTEFSSGVAGGGQPHENRPPFLALTYCTRD